MCILLALTIWLLRALNKDATEVFEISITSANQPHDFLISFDPPTVQVEIEASGFLILGTRYIRRKRLLTIETEDWSGTMSKRQALTSDYTRQIRRIVGSDRQVLAVYPDTITITRMTLPGE